MAVKDGAGTLTLSGSAEQLIGGNGTRNGVFITNNGANPVWVGNAEDPAVNSGVRLNGGGGSMYTRTTQALRVIGTAGDIVSFMED